MSSYGKGDNAPDPIGRLTYVRPETDELRTLLDQAFDVLEHDKSPIDENLERIWKCKPTCLKCRIGVALRTKVTGGEADQ